MMNYSLLDNGVDSLRAAYESLDSFANQQDGTNHNLKDAIIFLNHGIEILFKLILKNHSPALMFTDLKAYQKAKEEMKKNGKKDVFEVDSRLKTITLEEALARVEYLCDIEIPGSLKATIFYVNKIRNKIMHYGISMNDEEFLELTIKLQICYEETLNFLKNHIDDLEERIQEARFQITIDDYKDEQAEMMAEMCAEDAYIDWVEGAYEDLGEGKW